MKDEHKRRYMIIKTFSSKYANDPYQRTSRPRPDPLKKKRRRNA